MDEHAYAVIMAGGGGTRLWPLSRQSKPKQMLNLGGKRTLFQLAVDRLTGLFAPDHIYVVTVADQAAALQGQCPELDPDNFLLEPMPRGTASVVGLAAVALRQRDPQAVMTILTADHFIPNVDAFQKTLQAAMEVARKGYLVTLGIHPTYPATGYGYIHRGNELLQVEGIPVYNVVRFKEKPDLPSAEAFIASGDHAWNSGMFIWTVDRIWREIQRQMPDLAARLDKIEKEWKTPQRERTLQVEWQGIVPQTVDYGIMENAQQVAVIPAADLGWSDVGSWDSLFEVNQTDEKGNLVIGANAITLDSSGTLVYSEDKERLIVTIGMQDMIVVDTGDALLVCPRSEAQKVRQIVNRLKEDGYHRYA
ncbi:MAG TPA: mannose-1-phosphate guanylyltransferase [Longilinea sp.]|nr:mannose-1-phosphate guanylyltransferase [Longilinea sp.]